MGMLDGLVGQIAREALNQNHSQMSQGSFGDILGSVVASQMGGGRSGGGMADILGSVLGANTQQSQGGGMLGQVLGSVLGGNARQQSSGKGMLLAALMPMILGWIQKKGGIGAALNELTGAGMQSQVGSWLGGGSNQPVPTDMLGKIFGQQEIDQVAQQTGATQSQVTDGLAQLLPEVINQFSPTGQLGSEQAANQEINDIMGHLVGMLGR